MRKMTFAASLIGLALPLVCNATECIIVAPDRMLADWQWYGERRHEVHPDVRFEAVALSTITNAFPHGAGLPCRCPQESIHAYLRQRYAADGDLRYVLLGGTWQEVNGVITRPCGNPAMKLPTDLASDYFYACLEFVGTYTKQPQAHAYPWDANGDGVYLDFLDVPNCDLTPELVVSRLPLKTGEEITTYVAKLQRGESPDFAGIGRFGIAASSIDQQTYPVDTGFACRDELEFYDGMVNETDPRHDRKLSDVEPVTRRRVREQISRWRPILEVKAIGDHEWTGGFATREAASADYYQSDREFGFISSHGLWDGAMYFTATNFYAATGLTLVNDCLFCCLTGMPDIKERCLGNASVAAPHGGALASLNNSRNGWIGNKQTFDDGYSLFLANEVMVNFLSKRLPIGDAWLESTRKYVTNGKGLVGSYETMALVEAILYGDPLVRVPPPPPSPTYAGPGLTVTGTQAWMTATLTQRPGETFTLGGEGTFRVMQELVVSNGNLTVTASGGVGHEGIRFEGEGEHVLDLALPAGERFFVEGVQNASKVRVQVPEAVVNWRGLRNVRQVELIGQGEVKWPDLREETSPFNGCGVSVGRDVKLIFDHIGGVRQSRVDWSGLTGEGTVEWRGGGWMTLPSENGRFASTLNVIFNAGLSITPAYDVEHPLEVRNMSGNGMIHCDYGGKGERAIRTYQTRRTEWKGAIEGFTAVQRMRLIVAGDGGADSCLVITNTDFTPCAIYVEKGGTVELPKGWLGKVVNQGGTVKWTEGR